MSVCLHVRGQLYNSVQTSEPNVAKIAPNLYFWSTLNAGEIIFKFCLTNRILANPPKVSLNFYKKRL